MMTCSRLVPKAKILSLSKHTPFGDIKSFFNVDCSNSLKGSEIRPKRHLLYVHGYPKPIQTFCCKTYLLEHLIPLLIWILKSSPFYIIWEVPLTNAR